MDAVLLLLSLVCACVSLTSACSCVWHKGPDFYCGYDMIFRGKAIGVYEERQEPVDYDDPYSKYDQRVELVYTMTVDAEIMVPEDKQGLEKITVRTPKFDNLCGTRFALDIEYVFFVRAIENGEFGTGLCDDNVMWDELSEFHKERISTHIPEYCSRMQPPPLPSTSSATPPEP